MLTALCYPRCSTCKKAMAWLDEHGVAYTYRDIAKDNPSAAELAAWHKASGLPIRRFFNTSGQLYRSLGLKDKLPGMSNEECYQLLATNGMLVKRPLLVSEDLVKSASTGDSHALTSLVLVGFREAEWAKRLLG